MENRKRWSNIHCQCFVWMPKVNDSSTSCNEEKWETFCQGDWFTLWPLNSTRFERCRVSWKERSSGKKFIRDKNFNVGKPLHFKDKHQIQNVAALRFSSVSKIKVLPSSSFWRASNRRYIKKHIKSACPELLGKGEPASGSVNSALGAEATGMDCFEQKGSSH